VITKANLDYNPPLSENSSMKALILAGLLATGFVLAESAEGAIVIPSDARIFVDAGSEFDNYLAAALKKRHVPLTVTTDKSKADFAIEAGARVVDLRNGEVVLAWTAEGKGALQSRRTAEALAKRLSDSMPRSTRHKASAFSKDPALNF
jgi:hypothetical protein